MAVARLMLLFTLALGLQAWHAEGKKVMKSPPPPWTTPPPAPPYETPPPYTYPPPSPIYDYEELAPATSSYVGAPPPPTPVYNTPITPYVTSSPPPTPEVYSTPVNPYLASPPEVYSTPTNPYLASPPPVPVYNTPDLPTLPPVPTYTVPSPPSNSMTFPAGFTTNVGSSAPMGSYSSFAQQTVAAATPSYPQASSAIYNTIQYVSGTSHALPDGQVRGGPGQLSGLTSDDLQEYVDSAIDCAARYGPSQLSMQERVMLILVDINAESGFLPWVSQVNGGWGNSIGPMQVTPTIWVPLYEQYGDGAGYDPNTIWGNMHIASWAISTIGMNGASGPGSIVFDGGFHPATWWTGLYYWSGGYSVGAGNADPYNYYRMLQEGDLEFLGYSTSMLDAGW